MSVLIVVATAAEAHALAAVLPVAKARVVVSGVGSVAAALTTWRALSSTPARLVVSAGIGGAYPGSGLQAGDVAVSSRIIQADLGAWDGSTGAGQEFLNLENLGLSILPTRQHYADFAVWDGAEALAASLGAAYGPMLTLNSVTGSAEQATQLVRRFPGALTEGMEGAGVAHAALLAQLPVLEVRGVSNPVGPRDRASWQIPAALGATARALEALLAGFQPDHLPA